MTATAAVRCCEADDDIAVGRLVRDRLGDEVADRLVDPMLGGVYAGRADDLSLATTMPALADALSREHTLTGAVRAVLADRPTNAGPDLRHDRRRDGPAGHRSRRGAAANRPGWGCRSVPWAGWVTGGG